MNYPGFFGRDERLDLTDMHHIHLASTSSRDEYLLLTVTGPDAHNRSEWGSFLRNVHCQIVEPWTLGRIAFPDLDDL